jgi:anti-sigma B factor antagonist
MGAMTVGRFAEGYAVRISGHGTIREGAAVQALARQAFNDPGTRLVLDLHECDGLDSTFLGTLVILHRQTVRTPGRFVVSVDHEGAQRLLGQCRLERMLTIEEERPVMDGEPTRIPSASLEPADLAKLVIDCHRQLAETGGPEADAFAGVADRLERELRR